MSRVITGGRELHELSDCELVSFQMSVLQARVALADVEDALFADQVYDADLVEIAAEVSTRGLVSDAEERAASEPNPFTGKFLRR